MNEGKLQNSEVLYKLHAVQHHSPIKERVEAKKDNPPDHEKVLENATEAKEEVVQQVDQDGQPQPPSEAPAVESAA